MVFHSVKPKADGELLRSLKPDLCLGELEIEGNAIPQLPDLYRLNGKFGYQRSIALLSEIFKVMFAAEETLEGGIQDGIA